MKSWLRRLRGALGLGLAWAVGWAPIGAVVGAVLHTLLPAAGPAGLGTVILLNAVAFGVLGGAGGTLFGGVLGLAEGRRRFDELSVSRFAAWGAIGGLLLGGLAVTAGLWGSGVGILGVAMTGAATVLGALSAAGTLALARSADDRELLEDGRDAGAVGLTDEERRFLDRG